MRRPVLVVIAVGALVALSFFAGRWTAPVVSPSFENRCYRNKVGMKFAVHVGDRFLNGECLFRPGTCQLVEVLEAGPTVPFSVRNPILWKDLKVGSNEPRKTRIDFYANANTWLDFHFSPDSTEVTVEMKDYFDKKSTGTCELRDGLDSIPPFDE